MRCRVASTEGGEESSGGKEQRGAEDKKRLGCVLRVPGTKDFLNCSHLV